MSAWVKNSCIQNASATVSSDPLVSLFLLLAFAINFLILLHSWMIHGSIVARWRNTVSLKMSTSSSWSLFIQLFSSNEFRLTTTQTKTELFAGSMVLMVICLFVSRVAFGVNPTVFVIFFDFLRSDVAGLTGQLSDAYMFFDRLRVAAKGASMPLSTNMGLFVHAYIWLLLVLPWAPTYSIVPFFYDTNSPSYVTYFGYAIEVYCFATIAYYFFFTLQSILVIRKISSKLQTIGVRPEEKNSKQGTAVGKTSNNNRGVDVTSGERELCTPNRRMANSIQNGVGETPFRAASMMGLGSHGGSGDPAGDGVPRMNDLALVPGQGRGGGGGGDIPAHHHQVATNNINGKNITTNNNNNNKQKGGGLAAALRAALVSAAPLSLGRGSGGIGPAPKSSTVFSAPISPAIPLTAYMQQGSGSRGSNTGGGGGMGDNNEGGGGATGGGIIAATPTTEEQDSVSGRARARKLLISMNSIAWRSIAHAATSSLGLMLFLFAPPPYDLFFYATITPLGMHILFNIPLNSKDPNESPIKADARSVLNRRVRERLNGRLTFFVDRVRGRQRGGGRVRPEEAGAVPPGVAKEAGGRKQGDGAGDRLLLFELPRLHVAEMVSSAGAAAAAAQVGSEIPSSLIWQQQQQPTGSRADMARDSCGEAGTGTGGGLSVVVAGRSVEPSSVTAAAIVTVGTRQSGKGGEVVGGGWGSGR